jgi:hypothetical protein
MQASPRRLRGQGAAKEERVRGTIRCKRAGGRREEIEF